MLLELFCYRHHVTICDILLLTPLFVFLRYLAVVLISACPRRSCMNFKSLHLSYTLLAKNALNS